MTSSDDGATPIRQSVAATPFAPEGSLVETVASKPTSNPVLRGAVFGALVGFIVGGLTGAVFCWSIEANDFLPRVASISAGVGLVGGAIVGGVERWWRGTLTRPDLATFIGGGFGLVIALLVFCGGFGAVKGSLSIFVSVGFAFVFPMIGLLIGAFFDRSYESIGNGKRRDGFVFGILGSAVAAGVLWLMIAHPSGDVSDEITRQAKGMIYSKWKEIPEMKDAVIRGLVVTRESDSRYHGTFNVVVNNQTTPYHLKIELRGSRILAQWRPVEE